MAAGNKTYYCNLLRRRERTPTFAADLRKPLNKPRMTVNDNPKLTGSTLQNRRLYQAVRAARLGNPNGLRLAGRRAALPPARRAELTMAVMGSLVIFLLLLLVVVR